MSTRDESQKYRIVSNFGYGDKSWVYRALSEEQVLQWFIQQQSWPSGTEFDELPGPDSESNYYYEEDDPDDVEDWDWQDS